MLFLVREVGLVLMLIVLRVRCRMFCGLLN